MGKKNKKKREKNKANINPALFALLSAIDTSVMIQEEKQEKWIAEEHSEIENYFHYRASLFGR